MNISSVSNKILPPEDAIQYYTAKALSQTNFPGCV